MLQNVIISAQTLINIINKYRRIGIKTGLNSELGREDWYKDKKKSVEFTPETVF